MGYNESGVRGAGTPPRHPALHDDLGCNGVGFLPSVYGGERVARLLAGDRLGPSIVDPRRGTGGPGARRRSRRLA
jgi:hypothetical protein